MRTIASIVSSVAVVGAALLVTLVIGGVARADLAPPDTCSSPGQPCQNAGPAYNQAGSCVAATCTKQIRSSDGGLTPVSYSCNACQVSGAAGTGGTSASGAGGTGVAGTGGMSVAGTGGAGTGGASSRTSGGSSGCAVAGKTGGGDIGLKLALGLVGLALVSRRRTSV